MVRIRTIQMRLLRREYEQIVNNARVQGFRSLSAFLRHRALYQDFAIEKKIYEIHAHLLGEARRSKGTRKLEAPYDL